MPAIEDRSVGCRDTLGGHPPRGIAVHPAVRVGRETPESASTSLAPARPLSRSANFGGRVSVPLRVEARGRSFSGGCNDIFHAR